MLKPSIWAVAILLCPARAQVPQQSPHEVGPPTSISQSDQGRHSREPAENYSQRFDAIKCAIVKVVRGKGDLGDTYGTGFYINADGDVATAVHVFTKQNWTEGKERSATADLPSQLEVTIINSSGSKTLHRHDIVEDPVSWAADVAVIRTREKPACWLHVGDDTKVKAGDHVVTMGFAYLAFQSLSMYEGIVSATGLETTYLVGKTDTNQEVQAINPFIRVQMPICVGLSGAPVIDDQNHAVAMISRAGMWPEGELDEQIRRYQKKDPAADKILGALAYSYHQFASPGFGDSVPLCYLNPSSCPKKSTGLSTPTSSRSGH
jgi:S1-C subfamily serine protease